MNIQKTILMTGLAAVILVSGCIGNFEEDQKIEGTLTEIIDGDTYDFESNSGKEYRIRILGVDTPEVFDDNDPEFWANCNFNETYLTEWGRKSTEFVEDNFEGKQAIIEKRGIDPYDRQRAKVYVQDEESLSRILLREGYANVFTARSFPEMQEYIDLEEDARQNRKGIWKEC